MPRHKPTTRTVTIEEIEEPTAEDLLKDPLGRQVMAADGVEEGSQVGSGRSENRSS
jgi:hypothetical protein